MNNLSGNSDKVQFLRHCYSVAMEIHFIMHLLEPGSVILLKPKQAVCILSNLLGDWGPTLTLSSVLMCFSQQPLLSII